MVNTEMADRRVDLENFCSVNDLFILSAAYFFIWLRRIKCLTQMCVFILMS